VESKKKGSFEASGPVRDASFKGAVIIPCGMKHCNISLGDYIRIRWRFMAVISSELQEGVAVEERKGSFDERYHASYACKLKTIPLEKIETAIAKAIGELTQDRVECKIINFNAKSQCAEIVISLDIGADKRYSK
jgi:hypothetical protein